MKTILLAVLLMTICPRAFAATEDFTTFTESDPDGLITVTSSTVQVGGTFATGYTHKNYGAGNFGDFEHLFRLDLGNVGNNSSFGIYAVNNGETSNADMDTNNKGILFWYTRGADGLYVKDYTNDNQDGALGTFNLTTHYITVNRTGTTLTVERFSDSARTTLTDTLSITSGSDAYSHAVAMLGLGTGTVTNTNSVQDLDLQDAGGGGGDPAPTHHQIMILN